MKKLIKNKKGNWADIPYFMSGALYIGLVIVIVFVLIYNFADVLNTNPELTGNDTVSIGYANDIPVKYKLGTDVILPIIYVLLLGFSVWSARKIESSHKFAFIMFIVSLFLVLLGMIIETAWQEFTTNTNIVGYISNFVITDFILSNMRLFVLAYCFIVGVSLYAKKD